jgi:N-methylhydantoinase A
MFGGKAMSYMIGVDVGGTFTDFSIFNTETGKLFHFKRSSTPADPSEAIVKGIETILQDNRIQPGEISYLAHGTTVATNALIEKHGAKVALLTTAGFKDLMEIGWQKRPSLYDLLKPKPQSLIRPGMKFEVNERILYDGRVKIPLDEKEVTDTVRQIKRAGAESIAVCTIFSFINPVHEKKIKDIIEREFPEAYVTISSELVPEFREFSRMSTTVLNAYLGPLMKRYVKKFEKTIRDVGITVSPYVTQSNGSIISIKETEECPIRTAVSGPSAGVIGAIYIGKQCGVDKIISLDIGGTSADISLIENGVSTLSSERLVEGYPARIPMLDIVTIGAGGGSLARIDAGGVMKVGPESAGANPGPACYGIGGIEPTVTDANILLGKLSQKKILGGRMAVYPERAEKAIKDHICSKTGIGLYEAANGIISVINSNMIRAIRVVSVERGYDVRDFSLMAFGGAGPLHACEVANELGISSIIIPPSPGTLCSLGLLMADTKFDLSRSNIMLAKKENLAAINGIFDSMLAEGTSLLEKERVPPERRSFVCAIDARYEHQNYEITVSLPGSSMTEEVLRNAVEAFHKEHNKNYGYFDRDKNIQIVNYKLSAIGDIDKPDMHEVPVDGDAPVPNLFETRKVLFQGTQEFVDCNIYDKADMKPGCTITGPAIIEQMDTTIVIAPEWTARLDGYFNLRVEHEGGQR